MAYIASEDYVNKRIYLHADTVTMDTIDMYNVYVESRTRRRLNANGERGFDRMVLMFGNDAAGGDLTPSYVDLANGVRIVPYDVSHRPLLTPTPLISRSEDLKGRDLFDRSSLSAGVEVDVDYEPQIAGFKIVEVNTGSGLNVAQGTQLTELHERLDLDPNKPNNYQDDKTAIANGDWTLTNTDNLDGTHTVQRS